MRKGVQSRYECQRRVVTQVFELRPAGTRLAFAAPAWACRMGASDVVPRRTAKGVDPFAQGELLASRGQHDLALQQFNHYIEKSTVGSTDPRAYAARGASAQALG